MSGQGGLLVDTSHWDEACKACRAFSRISYEIIGGAEGRSSDVGSGWGVRMLEDGSGGRSSGFRSRWSVGVIGYESVDGSSGLWSCTSIEMA